MLPKTEFTSSSVSRQGKNLWLGYSGESTAIVLWRGCDALVKLSSNIYAYACRVLALSDSVVEENLQRVMIADGKIHT